MNRSVQRLEKPVGVFFLLQLCESCYVSKINQLTLFLIEDKINPFDDDGHQVRRLIQSLVLLDFIHFYFVTLGLVAVK